MAFINRPARRLILFNTHIGDNITPHGHFYQDCVNNIIYTSDFITIIENDLMRLGFNFKPWSVCQEGTSLIISTQRGDPSVQDIWKVTEKISWFDPNYFFVKFGRWNCSSMVLLARSQKSP